MAKNQRKQIAYYVIADAIAATLAYTLLYSFRKSIIETERFGVDSLPWDEQYSVGVVFTTVFWLSIYAISGFYRDIYRRSRLFEIFQTFNTSLAGSIAIFFVLILDDIVVDYSDYYESFTLYFGGMFLFTAVFRFILSSRTNRRIQARKIWFNTLLIGSNENAVKLYNEINSLRNTTGNKFVGFVSVDEKIEFLVEKDLPLLGNYKHVAQLIVDHDIEEVLIAVESSEHKKLEDIINFMEECDVKIKMIPDTYDIIVGKVRMESFGTPLIEIKQRLMEPWQELGKRSFDILVSFILLLIFSPIMIFTALMVRFTSKGPIFFHQERVGLHGKSFRIIKFRSMVHDAEKFGPQLSSDHDPRITKWGKIMRKYRLDELPQFWNVFIGEMSIIGPRPERQFYIEQILEKAPHYRHLHRVKPGITSWGMVKFGYASNVEQMVQRTKFDLIYIENMSLFNDLKILFYTVLIVLQGRGK